MLSGVTASALEITGTAVFRMVVSSDSMKKATATSHGSRRFTASGGAPSGSAPATIVPTILSLAVALRSGPLGPARRAALGSQRERLNQGLSQGAGVGLQPQRRSAQRGVEA